MQCELYPKGVNEHVTYNRRVLSMTKIKKLTSPFTKDKLKNLKAGDEIYLTGIIYTARDAAHKKLCELLNKRKSLPFPLKEQILYYCGPTPAPPGKPIGSCGPTTSHRMDPFTPLLLKNGLSGMIGKGSRSNYAREAIKKSKAVYFLALGGCGALLAKKVKKSTLIAYPELGPEAIYELKVERFPLIVGIDSKGRSVYAEK